MWHDSDMFLEFVLLPLGEYHKNNMDLRLKLQTFLSPTLKTLEFQIKVSAVIIPIEEPLPNL